MKRAKRPYTSRDAIRAGAVAAALLCTPILTASIAFAEGIDADEHMDLFVPDKPNFYNPLKHSNNETKRYSTRTVALSNVELENAVDQILNNQMTAEQRALNYQWLEQHDNGHDDVKVGSKVLNKIMKMGFRTYWDGVRNKHYSTAKAVPDSSGNGKVTEDVEYKLRLSGNKIKLSFEYEF